MLLPCFSFIFHVTSPTFMRIRRVIFHFGATALFPPRLPAAGPVPMPVLRPRQSLSHQREVRLMITCPLLPQVGHRVGRGPDDQSRVTL